jgi:D-alanyl-D-alanine-carboxypeptidase/D-alanyl-D-alanine-endopeptidase
VLNRRTFTISIAAAATSGLAQALEVSDDAIRDILRQRIEVEKRSVGMAVCVVTPNRGRLVTWGRERLSDNRPVTSETVFEIGSVTKVFTALLLADLATHTSGLPRWPLLPSDSPPPQAAIQAAGRTSLEDFKAWFANVHPDIPPSAGAWWYSNVGYALLGMALAHRGGRPYEALLQARVIEPIGLRDTTWYPTPAMRPRLAEGHDRDLKPLPPFEGGIFIAAGGLRSTPHDLSRFAAAILPGSGARIAPDEELLLTVRRAAPWLGGVQALGWEVLDAPGGSFVNKDGVTFGQTVSMVVDPAVFDAARRTAIVAFSNTEPDMRHTTLSGGGVGAADIARHLLRPQLALGG